MAAHGTRDDGARGGELPDALPFGLREPSRLSWALGARVVEDEAATRLGRWRRADGWRLAVFRVTDVTVVLRVGTPVGRERFYGAPLAEIRDAIDALDAAPAWQSLD
ncbi:MAG: hypothetical protein ABEJ89_01005 [Haloarculaceae archaeon]